MKRVLVIDDEILEELSIKDLFSHTNPTHSNETDYEALEDS